MKKNHIFIFTLLILGAASFAATRYAAISWTIDKSHTSITFEAKHFFTNVPGAFESYEAEVNFDPENLEESSINVQIDVRSINTKNERRDGHLQSADFFQSDMYPYITFSSDNIVSTGDNNFEAYGTLTIKDVSTDFVMPFTLLGIMDSPWQENTLIAGFESEFSLLRNDYNVGTGDWISDAVVGDEIKVMIDVEVNTQKN
jgi:polyisoprenoid-binding protein YceI